MNEACPENTILGWVLLNGIDGVAHLQRAGVNENSFTGVNRAIWTGMTEMSSQNSAIDVVTLSDHLGFSPGSEGMVALFAMASENLYREMNVQKWIEILDKRRSWRAIDRWLSRVTQAAKERENLGEFTARLAQGVQVIMGDQVQSHRVSLADLVKDYYAGNLDLDEMTAPIPTKTLKRLLPMGGACRGNLIVVGGVPGAGKTTFALNWAQEAQAAREGGEVLMYSLEMTARELALRYLSCRLGIPESELHKWKDLAEREPEYKIDVVERLFDIDQIAADAEAACKSGDVRLIVIDHIQAIRAPGTKGDVERMDAVAARLKRLAKIAKVPVLVISHLNNNRDQYRGSGMINAYADLSLVMLRPDLESGDYAGENCVPVKVRCLKQRNGPTGTTDIYFDMPVFRFLDKEAVEPPC